MPRTQGGLVVGQYESENSQYQIASKLEIIFKYESNVHCKNFLMYFF